MEQTIEKKKLEKEIMKRIKSYAKNSGVLIDEVEITEDGIKIIYWYRKEGEMKKFNSLCSNDPYIASRSS